VHQISSLMSSYSDSSQNVSLLLLHWAVIMGRVSTEPGKKMPLHSIGSTNALIVVLSI